MLPPQAAQGAGLMRLLQAAQGAGHMRLPQAAQGAGHMRLSQAAQGAGHMRLSALSALPADCSMSQVGDTAGAQLSQSDCMPITHQARMMHAV